MIFFFFFFFFCSLLFICFCFVVVFCFVLFFVFVFVLFMNVHLIAVLLLYNKPIKSMCKVTQIFRFWLHIYTCSFLAV